jgi:hypothetical protein
VGFENRTKLGDILSRQVLDDFFVAFFFLPL